MKQFSHQCQLELPLYFILDGFTVLQKALRNFCPESHRQCVSELGLMPILSRPKTSSIHYFTLFLYKKYVQSKWELIGMDFWFHCGGNSQAWKFFLSMKGSTFLQIMILRHCLEHWVTQLGNVSAGTWIQAFRFQSWVSIHYAKLLLKQSKYKILGRREEEVAVQQGKASPGRLHLDCVLKKTKDSMRQRWGEIVFQILEI